MYSKPKGLYIKQRDRPVRRLSPRTLDQDELESPTDYDGRMSPEVHVENFGDGQIKADTETQWPGRDFEEDDSAFDHDTGLMSDEPQPSTSRDNFPIRAQKYMVRNNSYQDLVRAKYITVPEPNSAKSKTAELPESKRNLHGSVRSFTEIVDDPDFPLVSTPRTYEKPVARVSGTYRGYPTTTAAKASANHSHLATIRINPKRHTLKGVKGKMATVKAIPHDGAIHTVKGYHFGHNATVRAHNTGHAIKHLKHAVSSWDQPDGTFKRKTYVADRKEYYINQFAIELDRSDMESYSPGELLSGRIILELMSNIEIRFIELIIVGLASVHFGKYDPNSAKNSQEVLISKRSYVMGTPDGRWNSVVTAGKYVSRFKFKLPNNLPSTIKYENKESGFVFEVGYLVKARICDDMGSSSLRSTHSTNNYVKVLLTRRFPFMVRGFFDIHSIPKALQPVNHSEIVNMNCMPVFLDSTAITMSLDRSVFLAGDEIRVKLITSSGTARKIKYLTCDLQQRVASTVKPRQNFTVVQIYEHEPEGLHYKQKSQSFALFEFIIPTHSNFVPSFLPGIRIVKVTYTVMITIKFKTCSGKLFLECPIGIGPCPDPMSLNQMNMVPVFNRPIRFPHFSRDSHVTAKTQNGTAHSRENATNVTSVYKSKRTQLLCCSGDDDE